MFVLDLAGHLVDDYEVFGVGHHNGTILILFRQRLEGAELIHLKELLLLRHVRPW